MENKKKGRNCHQEIEVDATHQESNSLDVKENNRDGFRFFLAKAWRWIVSLFKFRKYDSEYNFLLNEDQKKISPLKSSKQQALWTPISPKLGLFVKSPRFSSDEPDPSSFL